MKTNKFKRAIVMLLAITMLLTSTGMASFAEAMGEGADKVSTEAVVTESGSDAVQAAAEEAAAEINDEKVPEAAHAGDASGGEADAALTAKDWEAGLPDKISKDVREAMAQVAKSQLKAEGDLYKAFANAESLDNWDASFVMFVLEYANVLGVSKAIGDESKGTVDKDDISVPVNADTDKWIKALKDKDLFAEISEEAAPEQGDIVFTEDGAAVVIDADDLTVIGAHNNNVEKFKADADKVSGFVSLKDIAPAEFKDEEQAEEPAEEAVEEADDADKEDAEELTEEELEAKKAEEAAERAAKAEKEAAERAAEEVAKAEEAGLTDQNVEAKLTAAPGIGGKIRSLFTSNKDKGVTISGYMPENATVKAYPVKVKIPGQEVLAAYDITIYVKDENGNDVEWQPEIPLNVNITSVGKDADYGLVSVYHMEEKGAEPEFVASAKTEDGAVEFKADSFSIYVISKDAITRTYTFKNGSDVYSKQVLQNGENLVKPADPTKNGSEFKYWSLTEGGEAFNDFITQTDIEETEEKTLHAVYGDDQVYVTYHDQDGAIVQRHVVARPTGLATVTEDTTKVNYEPKQDSDDVFYKFRYWTDDISNLSQNNPPQAGNAGVVTINKNSKDIDLYPVVSEGHWIYFDTNKSSIGGDEASVSYVAPIFVVNGDETAINNLTAAVPTTAGYQFAGWYTRRHGGNEIFKADGTKGAHFEDILNLDDRLANNPTLYAHWTKAPTADYTIVIWQQKLDAEGTDASDEYAFVESFTMEEHSTDNNDPAILGDDYKKFNIDTNYNNLHDPDVSGKKNPFYGFALNNTKTDVSKVVKPDGSTVLNVYYDRAVHTLTFTDPDYNNYVATTASSSEESVQYGYWNNAYRRIYYRNGAWRQTDRNNGTVYNGTRYIQDHTVTTITAPYGANVENYFPIKDNNGNVYKNNNGQATWVDINNAEFTVTMAKVMTMPGVDVTFRYRGLNNAARTLHYMWEDPTGTSTDSFTGASGVSKKYADYYSFTANYGQIYADDVYSYEGVDFVGYSYRTGTGAYTNVPGESVSGQLGNNNATEYCFYYDRHPYKVHFLDSDAGNTPLFTDVIVKYGVQMEDYNSDNSSNAYSPTKDNYTFTGWYADKGCTTRVCFTQTDYDNYDGQKTLIDTMPANDIRLYAGWKKIKFTVDMDPNGGVIGMPWNDHATYFNVELDDTIDDYSKVTRDYVKAEAGEGRYVYKYFNRATGPEQDEDLPDEPSWRRRAYYDDSSSGEYKQEKGVYTLIGWFKVDDNNEVDESQPYLFGTPVRENLKLKALWRRSSIYHIVYDAKDGNTEVSAPVDKDEYVEGAKAIVKGSIATPSGKVLDHWEVEKDGEHHSYYPNGTLDIKEDFAVEQADGSMLITMKAVYRDAKPNGIYMADYTFMTKNSSEGEYETYAIQTIATGETLERPEAMAAPSGYVFNGWYLDSDCTRRFEGFGTINFPVYTTLYAGYVKTYTVTYYMADTETGGQGEAIITTQTYAPGDYLNTLYVECPTDDDHTVAYWTDGTLTDGKPTQYAYKAYLKEDKYKVTKDLELWPVLTEQKLLYFDTQTDKCFVDPIKIPAEGWPVMPTEPVRAGYLFNGWFTEPEGGVEYEFNKTLDKFKTDNELEQDVQILYAHWVTNPNTDVKGKLTIQWYAQLPDGGHGDDSYELTYTETVDMAIGSYNLNTGLSPADPSNDKDHKNASDNEAALDAAFSGSDIYSSSCLKGIISGDDNPAGRYDAAYMDAYFEPSSSRETDSFRVDDTGDSVLKIYFDRKVYKYVFNLDRVYYNSTYSNFDYSGNNNAIYLGDSNEAKRHSQYSIDVWLEKDVYKEWPVLDDGIRSTTTSDCWIDWTYKAYTGTAQTPSTNKNFYFNGWRNLTSDKNYMTAVYIIDAAKINEFGSNESITLCVLGNYLTQTEITLQYYFDGVVNHEYDQFVNTNIGTKDVTANGNTKTFVTTFAAKAFDGYKVITEPEKGDYCYVDTSPRGEYVEVASGSVEELYNVYKYQIADSWKNTEFYNTRESHWLPIIGTYYTVADRIYINDLNANAATHTMKDTGVAESGYTTKENDYTVSIGSPNGNKKTSGDVWYYDSASDTYKSLSWKQFTTEVIIHETRQATKQVTVSGKFDRFYYESESYSVTLYDYDGVTQLNTFSEEYKTLMSGATGKIESAAYRNCIPEAPVGKVFDCWSTDPNGREPFVGTMPAHAIALYAKYKPATVTVTTVGYDSAGNETTDPANYNVVSKDYDTELRAFQLITPKKANATFDGWYEVGTGKFISLNDHITADTLVEPKFTPIKYAAVKYDVNEGIGTNPVDNHKYTTGSQISILAGKDQGTGAAFTKQLTDVDGKEYTAKFSGWNTKANGTGTDYYPGDRITIGPNDGTEIDGVRTVTLYAQYSKYRETELIYNKNADDAKFVDASDKTVELDEEYTDDDDNTILRFHLKFHDDLNENDSSTDSGRPNTKITIGETKDGTAFTVTREGYIFRGWSLAANSTVIHAKNGDSAYVNQLEQGGNTLYAVWEKRAELTLNGVENIYEQNADITDTKVEKITWEDDSDKTYGRAEIEALHKEKIDAVVGAQQAQYTASLQEQVINMLEQKGVAADTQQAQSLLDKAKNDDSTIVDDLVELGLSQEDAEVVAAEIGQIDQSDPPTNPLDGYVVAQKVLVDKAGERVTGIRYLLGDGTPNNMNRWQYTTDGTNYVDLSDANQIDIYYYKNPVQVKVFNVVTDKDNKIVKHIKDAVPAQGGNPAVPAQLETLTSGSNPNQTVSVDAEDSAVSVTGANQIVVDGNTYYRKAYAVDVLPTTNALSDLASISLTNDATNGIKLNGTQNTDLYAGTKVVYVVYQEHPAYIKLENNSSASQTFRLTIKDGAYHTDIVNGTSTVTASSTGTGESKKYYYDITVAAGEFASIYVPCGTGFTYSTKVLKNNTEIADLASEFLEWDETHKESGTLVEGPLKAKDAEVILPNEPTETFNYSHIKLNDMETATLTVNNTVTGEFSNADTSFDIKVTLTKEDNDAFTDAEKNAMDGFDFAMTGEGETATPDKTKLVRTVALTGENGSNSATFEGIPSVWNYQVEELDSHGYTVEMKIGNNDFTETSSVTGTIGSDGSTVSIKNTLGNKEVVPSGIAKSNMILIPLFLSLILVLGIVLSIIQRRRLASRTR